MNADDLLKIMLPPAVILRTLELLKLPEDKRPKPDDIIQCLECGGVAMGCATCGDHGRLRRSDAYASYIGAHGDMLQYRGKKGKTAKAFNVLAECICLMSFVPGGIEFMGMRFDATELENRFKSTGKIAAAVSIIRKTEPQAARERRPY